MKIGIITYHKSHNYGALLQAIALRIKLVQMGHDVYFIDYWPLYHKQLYDFFSIKEMFNYGIKDAIKYGLKILLSYGEFYQFNLSSCIRQQNSLTAQFVSFSLANLANIFYPPPDFYNN